MQLVLYFYYFLGVISSIFVIQLIHKFIIVCIISFTIYSTFGFYLFYCESELSLGIGVKSKSILRKLYIQNNLLQIFISNKFYTLSCIYFYQNVGLSLGVGEFILQNISFHLLAEYKIEINKTKLEKNELLVQTVSLREYIAFDILHMFFFELY